MMPINTLLGRRFAGRAALLLSLLLVACGPTAMTPETLKDHMNGL